jgi:predicted porin
VKIALEIAEPYKISADTAKTPAPRVETEISYAGKIGSAATQAWISGMYQVAPRSNAAGVARAGQDNESIGGAYGASVSFSGLSLLGSGYVGKGLGMVSAQDGDFLGSTSVDANGKERTHWGYLLQATYQLTPSFKLGANYGSTRQNKNKDEGSAPPIVTIQESAVFSVTYNLNKFTQFVGEYIYAQNTWYDNRSQHSNQFALGTMFYW